jgi:hypothetical protein
MKTYIKVIEEDNKLKKRIDALRGPYTLSLFCYKVLEKEVERLEKKAKRGE